MVFDRPYDYVVVGSGPGGAAVARELASQKKRILIVEYGHRLSETGFWKSTKMFQDLR
jgi:choline dehydrogenase-like flavoprotein